MSALYAFPNLDRSGLGNLLITWARAEAFAGVHGARVLAPRWSQPKIGPLLRGEKDKRYYVGLFDNSGYLQGPRRYGVLLGGKRIDETEIEPRIRLEEEQQRSLRPLVVEFRGMEGLFAPLLPQREWIVGRLRQILHPRLKPKLERTVPDHIAVHVRRGDFIQLPAGQAAPRGAWNYRIADEWYVACIQNIRNCPGFDLPAIIYSDGKPDELADILRLERTELALPNPSIVDIFSLARGKVLVASGSTFSMWASFIGQMPTLWYPGQQRQVLNREQPELDCETDAEGRLTPGFESTLASQLEGA